MKKVEVGFSLSSTLFISVVWKTHIRERTTRAQDLSAKVVQMLIFLLLPNP